MKKIFVFIILFFITHSIFGQENCFPLYFEDAVGNRDTVWFGFDPMASNGIDTYLGEKNLIGEPYDSIFSIFFSDATYYDENMIYNCFEAVSEPTFQSKKQIIGNQYYPFEVGIIAKKWPICISWDKSNFENITLYNIYGNEEVSFFITSWNPPGGWFDASCCGHSMWPDSFTELKNNDSIRINRDLFCDYMTNYTADTIFLLFIGFEPSKYLSISSLNETDLKLDYSKRKIILPNRIYRIVNKYKILNLEGKTIISNKIYRNFTGGTNEISVENLNHGTYIIVFYNNQNQLILSGKFSIIY